MSAEENKGILGMCLKESIDRDAGNVGQDSSAYMLVAVGCICVEVGVAVKAKPMQPTKMHRDRETYIPEIFSSAVKRSVQNVSDNYNIHTREGEISSFSRQGNRTPGMTALCNVGLIF